MADKGTYYAHTLWAESEDTKDMRFLLSSEAELVSAALQLGARRVAGWSRQEAAIAANASEIDPRAIRQLRESIRAGNDPLGDAFCALRSPKQRRTSGATYTPVPVAEAMVSWAGGTGFKPSRVIEPGAGSARFLSAAAKAFPNASLFGIEIDPVAAIVARANLATLGYARRATIIVGDFRLVQIPEILGVTLYVGNPPYVRHHQLDPKAKQWLTEEARRLGLRASQLAGLHVYFFLATVLKARKDDFGAFITSAEWLDVNYGALVRQLFMRNLGGYGITVVEPTTRTFADADTTSAITQFIVGTKPSEIRVSRTKTATAKGALTGGLRLARTKLEHETRWSVLTRPSTERREGYVELGELCRVHRGQATGANKVWIAGSHSRMLPSAVLFPSVTRAKELISTGNALEDTSGLRDVIDIPVDLSIIDRDARKSVDAFLKLAKSLGADSSYIARNRKAWWSVGLRSPAPILATYMARRTPKFVRNLAEVRHINIAHGIYPRRPMDSSALDSLVRYLSSEVSVHQGRTYAGGLTKFEPREMERILVPHPVQNQAMLAS